MSVHGKNAVVTGSTSGIGLGIAQTLAGQGANVMLNGFGDDAQIAALRKTIERTGVTVGYSDADLRDADAARGLIDDAAATLGGVDILVNNAGIQHTDPVEQFPARAWDDIIALNLSAAFHTTAAALPHMRKAKWGRIINIASVHGLVASVNKAGYIAAKHGLVGLSKVVALETVKEPITCNAVCPGWVRTPLVEQQLKDRAKASGKSVEEEARLLLSEKQPSEEFVTPEQIGEMVLFLCSDTAKQITGSAYTMDGGWTAQ